MPTLTDIWVRCVVTKNIVPSYPYYNIFEIAYMEFIFRLPISKPSNCDAYTLYIIYARVVVSLEWKLIKGILQLKDCQGSWDVAIFICHVQENLLNVKIIILSAAFSNLWFIMIYKGNFLKKNVKCQYFIYLYIYVSTKWNESNLANFYWISCTKLVIVRRRLCVLGVLISSLILRCFGSDFETVLWLCCGLCCFHFMTSASLHSHIPFKIFIAKFENLSSLFKVHLVL